MRCRGVHHIELTVPHYEEAIAFYDRMFGWLGYKSFWTLDIEYRSTYYVAGGLPHYPHSYIGIQPAQTDAGHDLRGERYQPGLNHLALAARSPKEIDPFYTSFLQTESLEVIDAPAAYPHYAPGYYAVFFRDPPLGATWELAFMPLVPSPVALWKSWQAWKRIRAERRREKPGQPPLRMKDALRKLPGK
ncbi:MAG: hypothetical protein E1N59_1546 [Puniceicoccaceae bacterium 5H]|nr:MAG: hypothetical protein E1N59_1546 [Puniceicoccaceae bacterium 5H]